MVKGGGFPCNPQVKLSAVDLRTAPLPTSTDNHTGVIILTISGGYQSQKVGLFAFNPPLTIDFDPSKARWPVIPSPNSPWGRVQGNGRSGAEICRRMGGGCGSISGSGTGEQFFVYGCLRLLVPNDNPGLINPWLINRGVSPFSGDSEHFWREHPPNNGTGFINPGSTLPRLSMELWGRGGHSG